MYVILVVSLMFGPLGLYAPSRDHPVVTRTQASCEKVLASEAVQKAVTEIQEMAQAKGDAIGASCVKFEDIKDLMPDGSEEVLQKNLQD